MRPMLGIRNLHYQFTDLPFDVWRWCSRWLEIGHERVNAAGLLILWLQNISAVICEDD